MLHSQQGKIDYDGYLVLFLCLLIIMLTMGFGVLVLSIYVFIQAKKPQPITPHKLLLLLGKKLLHQKPDSEFVERLECCLAILTKNKQHKVFILGGKTNDNISESYAGEIFLQQRGINNERIFIEEKSRHTLENLKQFQHLAITKNQAVSLITNRYHLARSIIMAKGFAINADPYPAEKTFNLTISNISKIIIEGFYLHFYFVGRYFAKLTNNQRILSRISV